MDWYIRNAVAGRLNLFGNGVLTGTHGVGDAERSLYGFSGAPGVDIDPLYKIERRCEWYVAEKFHVLGRWRANAGETKRAPEDIGWAEEADACVWVAERQFVFEIKSGRSYDRALREAASLTLGGARMLLTFRSHFESQIWVQRTQENFSAFMSGAPIYLTVEDVAVLNVDSKA